MNTIPRVSRQAFTLIELLVVIAIIAILVSIALPMYNQFLQRAAETKTLSNMRQLGSAVLLYSGDNNNQLPGRVNSNKWPKLLLPYTQNVLVYYSPIPNYQGQSYKASTDNLYTSDDKNYTSYIYNGFNEAGAYTNPAYTPRLNLINRPSATILFGVPVPPTTPLTGGNFYMDFLEHNEKDVLNTKAFSNRSEYMFCDGSARTLNYTNDTDARSQTELTSSGNVYCDWYWLVNKP